MIQASIGVDAKAGKIMSYDISEYKQKKDDLEVMLNGEVLAYLPRKKLKHIHSIHIHVKETLL